MHDFRLRTTELVHTEMPEARQGPFPVELFWGQNPSLLSFVNWGVSTRWRTLGKSQEERKNARDGKKNYRLLFFLECFQILKLALYTKNFAMRVIPIVSFEIMLDSLLYSVVVIGFQNLETWEKSIIFWLYFREGETFRSMDRLEAKLTFWTRMTSLFYASPHSILK